MTEKISRFAGMRALYLKNMQVALQREMQYRFTNFVGLLGFMFEPVIYLAVWTSIAKARGGTVNGYSAGALAAYYIVWTLVRSFNLVSTPYGFERRIQNGQISAQLLRPAHPIHYDLSYFAGWKLVSFLFWIPMAFVLTAAFKPSLSPTPLEIGIFVLAIWGGYLIRSIFQWALGLFCFWTTRVAAVFELYMVLEVLLSGRLVPLSFLPPWAQHVADFLPFQWCYAYPIETLIGRLNMTELFVGLAMQVMWIAVGSGLVALVWKRAARRHTAVGN